MKLPTHIKITLCIVGLLIVIGYQTSNGYAFFTGILGIIIIAELEISLIYAEDFNSAALENLMRSGSIAIIEAVWEGGMLCPKIIMLDYEQSHSIRNYLHI